LQGANPRSWKRRQNNNKAGTEKRIGGHYRIVRHQKVQKKRQKKRAPTNELERLKKPVPGRFLSAETKK